MKINTTISLEETVLNQGRAYAKSHNRSFSNLLECWIQERLAEAPTLPDLVSEIRTKKLGASVGVRSANLAKKKGGAA